MCDVLLDFWGLFGGIVSLFFNGFSDKFVVLCGGTCGGDVDDNVGKNVGKLMSGDWGRLWQRFCWYIMA